MNNKTILIFIFFVLINTLNGIAQFKNTFRATPIQEKEIRINTTINVKDFGAIPDDGKNDWEAISNAIKELQSKGDKTKIIFPKGTYNIVNPENKPYAFYIKDINNFILDSEGAIFIIDNPTQAFISFQNCTKGVIKGFTVDYSTLPFTQGIITNVNKKNNSFQFILDENYSDPTGSNFTESKTKWGVIFDKNNNKLLKNNSTNLVPIRDIIHSSNRTYNITTSPAAIGSIEKGDPYAMIARYNGRSTYSIFKCKEVSFFDNTNYAGPAGSFGTKDSDNINYVRCKILKKDGRLISQNADCIHVTPSKIGPWIEGCVFEGQMDDAINIKTELVLILQQLNSTEFIVKANLLKDDKLMLFNPREGVLIEECNVISSKKVRDGSLITIDKEIDKKINIGNTKDCDMFFNISKSNSGFIIKDNIFKNSRRYGMLIQARDGIIDNNIFEGNSTGAITMQNSASWPEGFVPRNIKINNNTIINCGFDASYWREGENIAPILIRTMTHTKDKAKWQGIENIEITNNTIESNSSHAVYLYGVKNIKIQNNKSNINNENLYFIDFCSKFKIK